MTKREDSTEDKIRQSFGVSKTAQTYTILTPLPDKSSSHERARARGPSGRELSLNSFEPEELGQLHFFLDSTHSCRHECDSSSTLHQFQAMKGIMTQTRHEDPKNG